MKIPDLSILSCSRGAPMGRRDSMQIDHDDVTKMHLHQMPLEGGYDHGGAYWGSPNDLWRLVTDEDDEGEYYEAFFRASSREKAIELVAQKYQKAVEILPPAFHLQTSLASYVSCLYDDWQAECLDDPEEAGKEGAALTDEALKSCSDDLIEFANTAGDSAALYEPAQFGYLFYVSRQGHGVGFFEHPEKDGQRLQELARKVGPVDAYSLDGQDLEV